MIKNLHDIDKIFKDGLGEHTEPVPSSVWESLNNDLDKKQAAHFREKYFRLKKLALLLLLLIVFSGSYLFYFYPSHKKDSSIAGKKTNSPIDAGNRAAPEKNTQSPPIARTATQQTIVKPIAQNGVSHQTGNEATVVPANQQRTKDGLQVTHEKPADRYQKLSTDNIVPEKNIPSPAKSPSIFVDNNSIAVAEQLQLKKGSHRYNASPSDTDTVKQNNQYPNQQEASSRNGFVATSTNTGNKISGVENNKNNAAWLWENFLPPVPAAEIPLPGWIEPAHAILLNDSITKNVKKQVAISKAKNNAISIHRFSLMVFGAPNHSFTRLQNDGRLSGPGHDKNEVLRSEQQGSSFSAGILVNYGLSGHLTIQSGLVFSAATTVIAPKTIYAKPDNNGHARYELNCSSGYAYFAPKTGSQPAVGDSINIMGSSTSISYIGVPVSINYTIKAGKFLIKPGVGFSLNFLTGNHSATNFNLNASNEKESANISGLKNNYLDGSLGLGIEYRLNRRISAGIRPLMRWALSSINKNTPVKTYQNYTSLETGLKINL